MFGLQPWHLIAILAVALIIFGPSRLPEVGKAVGKSLSEFRAAASQTTDELRKGLDEANGSSESGEPDVESK